MAKRKKTVPPLRLGARAATSGPRRNKTTAGSGNWKFYIRPSTDEANEKIARILAKFGNIEEYERCLELPGYTEKQGAYLVPKFIRDDVGKNQSVRNQYEAFVQKTKDGKFYRHRTPEQIQAEKNQKAKRASKRTQPPIGKVGDV